ncbi:MAG: c-type cytochrome, partial [Planctomycetes bacterium]|nr:c-type cytochrome [Planctomycetota bacterium]
AIEHQPVATWAGRAIAETDPARQVEALLALVRAGGIDPLHRKPTDPPVDNYLRDKVLAALMNLDWGRLAHDQQVTLVRAYEICFVRFGQPDRSTAARVIAQLDAHFPADTRELNWVLCETLAYLQSPSIAAKAVALIRQAPSQEEQLEYARSLRFVKAGWTPELHAEYFRWFLKAANYHGGASFEKFIEFIRAGAVASLSDAERAKLASVLAEQPVKKSLMEGLAEIFKGRTAANWTLEELSQTARTSLSRRNYENGRKMFGAAACFTCHRFGNEGGMNGPDLTGAGGRYSPHDLLDQIVNPSKEINEQFVPIAVTTAEQVITGVVVNLNGDTVTLNTDAADPNQRVTIDRKQVLSIEPSKLSPMPTGLLNLLTKDEILDLVAYVLSAGNPRHEVFGRSSPSVP